MGTGFGGTVVGIEMTRPEAGGEAALADAVPLATAAGSAVGAALWVVDGATATVVDALGFGDALALPDDDPVPSPAARTRRAAAVRTKLFTWCIARR